MPALPCCCKAFQPKHYERRLSLPVLGYIVASATGTLYTGLTGDLYKRIMQHKAGKSKVSRKIANVLVWFITKASTMPEKMIQREKQIKTRRREKKIALIEKTNRHWQDFAENWGRPLLLPGESMSKKTP